MKALIICPAERPTTALLAEHAPLVNFPILGKPLIYNWLEFLAAKGAREIMVLATDRPAQVRACVGDGARWGLKIDVVPESRELTVREARKKYRPAEATDWLPQPLDVAMADYLPAMQNRPLFFSYGDFFSVVSRYQPCITTNDRIGLRQAMPGVWVGRRAQIARTAKLIAPCWIGENVAIGPKAVIGPGAIIEDRCFIDANAEVTHSIVAPETFVGKSTTIRNSIALGDVLINWQTDSHTYIEDRFLMCDLNRHKPTVRSTNVWGRLAAAALLLVTAPVASLWAIQSWARGQNFVQQRCAVRPGTTAGTVDYFEFTNCDGLWRRWPQLLNVMRGDFAWVGNRPITPVQAATLTNDFEKLWLAAPIGLCSQADAAGCVSEFNDEARAHASFYAAQAGWKLDLSILLRVWMKAGQLKQQRPSISLERPAMKPEPLSLTDTVLR